MQIVKAKHGQLLEMKKEDVLADVQAAMAEIHQTARLDQKSIVERQIMHLSQREKLQKLQKVSRHWTQ